MSNFRTCRGRSGALPEVDAKEINITSSYATTGKGAKKTAVVACRLGFGEGLSGSLGVKKPRVYAREAEQT